MKKVYITGVSGTGKTTLARNLEHQGFNVVSIDEVDGLCSWVHQVTKEKHSDSDTKLDAEFVGTHDWICDVDHLTQLLTVDSDIVFVLGMAGNQDDFLPLFDTIILLECSPETFCRRIDERTDNDFGKDPAIKEQILNRYQSYGEKLKSQGALVVNAEKSETEVVSEILSIV